MPIENKITSNLKTTGQLKNHNDYNLYDSSNHSTLLDQQNNAIEKKQIGKITLELRKSLP